MRKLRRRPKKQPVTETKANNLSNLKKIKKIKSKKKEKIFDAPLMPIKTISRYKKQKCAYIFPDGSRCKKFAVGKSSLCKKHGGDPVIKENLLVGREAIYAVTAQNKFDVTYHPFAYLEYARQGLSDVEIASKFEVATSTLNRWAEKYETFNTVWEIGQAMHEAWWLEKGKNNLENKRNFNSSLYKYMTMNKLGWSDKIEQRSLNMSLHGVLVAPDPVSDEEWEEDIVDI